MSTTVLVLLYAYRTVTLVLTLVNCVRVILITEYLCTTVSYELGVIRTIQDVSSDCLCPTVSKLCTIG